MRLLDSDEEIVLAKKVEKEAFPMQQMRIRRKLTMPRRNWLTETSDLWSLLQKISGTGSSVLDLIQEGNLGLLKAVDKFDYTKGISFQLMRHGGSDRR